MTEREAELERELEKDAAQVLKLHQRLIAALDALRFHGYGGGLCHCGLCKELPVPDDLKTHAVSATSNQERKP